jgi:hypothetical protein
MKKRKKVISRIFSWKFVNYSWIWLIRDEQNIKIIRFSLTFSGIDIFFVAYISYDSLPCRNDERDGIISEIKQYADIGMGEDTVHTVNTWNKCSQ